MPVDDVREASERSMRELNKERRWEIHARYGLRHFAESTVTESVAAYRATFKVPETEELKGTVMAWVDGAPTDKRIPLSVALASEAELKARKETTTQPLVAVGVDVDGSVKPVNEIKP